MTSARRERAIAMGELMKGVAGALAAAVLTVSAMAGVFRLSFQMPLGLPFLLSLGAAFACWRSRRVPGFVVLGILIGTLLMVGLLVMITVEWSSNPI